MRISMFSLPYEGVRTASLLDNIKESYEKLVKINILTPQYAPLPSAIFADRVEKKEKGWFGRERNVLVGVDYYLEFERDLTSEEIAFWRGFVVGAITGWSSRR